MESLKKICLSSNKADGLEDEKGKKKKQMQQTPVNQASKVKRESGININKKVLQTVRIESIRFY